MSDWPKSSAPEMYLSRPKPEPADEYENEEPGRYEDIVDKKHSKLGKRPEFLKPRNISRDEDVRASK